MRALMIGRCLTAMLAPVLLSGCVTGVLVAGAAVGVGGIAYEKGELRSTQNGSLDQTWEATQAAVQELQLPVVDKTKDGLNAQLEARTGNDKKIHIRLKKEGEALTEIRIRIGTFGDEAQSRSILDAIKKRLPQANAGKHSAVASAELASPNRLLG
jgi:hypothetical protein